MIGPHDPVCDSGSHCCIPWRLPVMVRAPGSLRPQALAVADAPWRVGSVRLRRFVQAEQGWWERLAVEWRERLTITQAPILFRDPQALAALCRRHHIRRLSLFGSRLAGTARPDSDVDLLVEFDHGHAPGLIGLATIEAALSELLGGQRVDLRTAGDLSRYFRDEVVAGAALQYAA